MVVSPFVSWVMTAGPVGTSQSGAMPRSYQATPDRSSYVSGRTTGRGHNGQEVVERAEDAPRS